MTCGRPSARTVEMQKSSAVSIFRRVSPHLVTAAFGSLNRVSSLVFGCFFISPPSAPTMRLEKNPIRIGGRYSAFNAASSPDRLREGVRGGRPQSEDGRGIDDGELWRVPPQ